MISLGLGSTTKILKHIMSNFILQEWYISQYSYLCWRFNEQIVYISNNPVVFMDNWIKYLN